MVMGTVQGYDEKANPDEFYEKRLVMNKIAAIVA
jgi:hypothetical protein